MTDRIEGFQIEQMNDTKTFNCEVDLQDALLYVYLNKSFYGSGSWTVTFHNHPVYEVHLIKSGEHLFNINHREITLHAGSCCIISPHVYHSIMNISDEVTSRCSFRFSIAPKNGMTTSEIINCANQINKYCIFENNINQVNLVDRIITEFDNTKLSYTAVINSYFVQLVISILREVFKTIQVEGKPFLKCTQENREAFIDGFFNSYYMKDLKVQDLAQTLYLSVRQVTRILQESYGLTFLQKLTQHRIYHACYLLRNKTYTVTKISEMIGYNNPNFFFKIFKQTTGMTPKEYRNMPK